MNNLINLRTILRVFALVASVVLAVVLLNRYL